MPNKSMKKMEIIMSNGTLGVVLSTKMFLILSYQENFINWTLDIEHYFAYANIPEYFNVQFVLSKFASDAGGSME